MKSRTCRCLHTVSVGTCFNSIYLCSAELEAGLDEAGMGDTNEEEKKPKQNDVHTVDSKGKGMHTLSVKPAELREYNHLRSRT